MTEFFAPVIGRGRELRVQMPTCFQVFRRTRDQGNSHHPIASMSGRFIKVFPFSPNDYACLHQQFPRGGQSGTPYWRHATPPQVVEARVIHSGERNPFSPLPRFASCHFNYGLDYSRLRLKPGGECANDLIKRHTMGDPGMGVDPSLLNQSDDPREVARKCIARSEQ